MEYKDILFEIEGRIATLTFNMPDSRNPIGGETTIEEIVDGCRQVQDNDGVSVMIVTGAGKAFSAGGNVENMRGRNQGFGGGPLKPRQSYPRGTQRIPLAMYAVDVPIIAAVNGAAIGAGCDMAMMADIRIASTSAKFGETFLGLGPIPGGAGSWFLARLIGHAKLAESTFTGKVIDAAEALEMGLVSKVVEPERLLPEVRALAETIAEKPPRTLRLAKLLMKQASRMELKDFLDVCAQTQDVVKSSQDHREAIEAFFEKRPANFVGE